jgi:hypothetical protein
MSNETIDAFPLSWPVGYARSSKRISSNFKQSMDRAQRFLGDEIQRLGGTGLIVSTNLPIRKDGGIYADYLDKLIDDPGVAIYFKHKGKTISMCCDQYRRVWENIYALGKGIEALRGMERWGVSDFLDRAFTGFTALPPANETKQWWELLLIGKDAPADVIRSAYRHLAKKYHPDAELGNTAKFQEIQAAYEQAKLQRPGL